MEKVLLKEVVNIVNGKVVAGKELLDKTISSVITDSRRKTENGLFVAIKGENTDGHKYIDMAKENGAIATIISYEQEEYLDDMVYILVKDSLDALKEFATAYRSKFNIPIVAITGSVGKTTTKDMIASVLNEKYNVLKTEGNFNSEIGVPLTALNLMSNHEIAVIELGMDHVGEISGTSKIVKPDTAVYTNIGIAHIEHLKSRENILKAKCEMFENMKENALLILNADDDMLVTINNSMEKVWYGKAQASDVKLLNTEVEYNKGVVIANVLIKGEEFTLEIPGLSEHLVYAALPAICVGLKYNVEIKNILEGIKNYTPTKMRMDIKALDNNILLIDDTYNANPTSMKSLIDTISKADKKNKIAILGDMFELGEDSIKLHTEVIQYAVDKDLTNIIVVGNNMEQAVKDVNNTVVQVFSTKEELYEKLKSIIVPDSIIGIKASRGMKFENIVEKVIEVI